MGKIINKIKKGVATGLVGVLFACPTIQAASMNLEIKSQILEQNPECISDTYNAIWDSDNLTIENGYDNNDVEQTANIGVWNSVQMYSIDTGPILTEDYRVFDPTDSDSIVCYPIELIAKPPTPWGDGINGTNRTTIVDPNELDNIPSNYTVRLKRYDRNDNFVAGYNLRDPDNHTIEWEVTNALGKYGALDLHIAEYPPADINGDEIVNLIDFSYLAGDWLKEEGGLDGDLDNDGDCDFADLEIMVGDWLWYIGD